MLITLGANKAGFHMFATIAMISTKKVEQSLRL